MDQEYSRAASESDSIINAWYKTEAIASLEIFPSDHRPAR